MKKKWIVLSILAMLSIQLSFAQTVNITGTVTNASDGAPIPGVSVLVKGTTMGTVTRIDGTYNLTIPTSATTLVFSFIGMITNEVTIQGETKVDIIMKSDAIGMDEVVVTALGIKRERKALGYAVQDVEADEIAKTGNSDLAGALQGKVAGINITPSSGMPGASSNINIRGARSFTGNNSPLYIVDGMPISSTSPYSTGNSVTGSDIANRALDINPADIESINILKGQAAAALYGMRASNGAIVITTKSGKGNKGKAVVNLSHTSSFDRVSVSPDFQQTYAQGSGGVYNPNSSMSWGPKITDLPYDAKYGGETVNEYTNLHGMQPGKFYVPQLAQAGLDPWATPQVYDNFNDYVQGGYTSSTNAGISNATERSNYSIGVGHTEQTGVIPGTGMTRWTARGLVETNLNDNFKTGFSANFSESDIDKSTGGNDGLAGIYGAPASYNMAGIPYHVPGDPYSQIYYRGGSFSNPYWVAENNVFNEVTQRFFGNAFIEYNANISSSITSKIKYQLGADSYTSHYQDIFAYGSMGKLGGEMENYGVTSTTYNSLATAHFDWSATSNTNVSLLVGNEINNSNSKTYYQYGKDFNFGGWHHIDNATTFDRSKSQRNTRTVGFFGELAFSYKSMLFANITGRNDYVSTMPAGNRSFFYPSASLGFVFSELDAIKELPWLSFGKIRGSYAEVGQAGSYYEPYYITPTYGGGWWSQPPIIYPIDGVSAYTPSRNLYDPNLTAQNTKSYEIGIDLKFLNNRIGIDYTFSSQDTEGQIFNVPLAGSTGASQLTMNAGNMTNDTHEIVIYATPVKTKDFTWEFSVNLTKMNNQVVKLAEGVESIFLGGFTIPQIRAAVGTTFPAIYGNSYERDNAGNIVVIDNPGAWNHGFPAVGEPDIVGSSMPDFILGGTNTFTYKNLSLSTVFEYKYGGKMYAGTTGVMSLYGVTSETEDRNSTFIINGVKPDGTPNDIVRGGAGDEYAYQDYFSHLNNIDESAVLGNSFLKIRELALRYKFPKSILKDIDLGMSVFARNLLLWSELDHMDPETSQGNTNMGGAFERFSLPQTQNFGFSIDLTF
nr:SusC/RagA family TonB-linked outer membrane protein [uncultured Carboxylicivirga sp.]